MSVNLTSGVIPFTELFERVMTLARIDSFNQEDFAKGLVNDSYTRTLPSIEDWQPLIQDAFLTMTPKYTVGTVSVASLGTAVTGVTTVWTTAMTAAAGYKIKFASNENVYGFTATAGTAATLSTGLSGASDLSGTTYVVFQDEYTLASDFDRFLAGGSIYPMSGGRAQDPVEELPRDQFRAEATVDPSDPIRRCMLLGMNSAGLRKVRLNPPPSTAKVYPYEYIPRVSPMLEYTVGTIDATNASAVISGTDTVWDTNVTAGMYFRVDARGTGDSSKWYKILSVDSATQITLEAVYGDATESGTEYTICSAPTMFPPEFHEFILYDSVSVAVASNTDPNSQVLIAKRGDVLSRLKRNYKSRRNNPQFGVDDDGYR